MTFVAQPCADYDKPTYRWAVYDKSVESYKPADQRVAGSHRKTLRAADNLAKKMNEAAGAAK